MDITRLTNDEVVLAARALSIHRASMRRKLEKLRPGTREYQLTLAEVRDSQELVNKLQSADLARLGGVA
jgi:hypothetical protein